MSKWVTDPAALRAIITLRGIQAGDEILQEYVYVGESPSLRKHGELQADTLRDQAVVELVHEAYDNPELVYKSAWKLVGWRRPRRRKREQHS